MSRFNYDNGLADALLGGARIGTTIREGRLNREADQRKFDADMLFRIEREQINNVMGQQTHDLNEREFQLRSGQDAFNRAQDEQTRQQLGKEATTLGLLPTMPDGTTDPVKLEEWMNLPTQMQQQRIQQVTDQQFKTKFAEQETAATYKAEQEKLKMQFAAIDADPSLSLAAKMNIKNQLAGKLPPEIMRAAYQDEKETKERQAGEARRSMVLSNLLQGPDGTVNTNDPRYAALSLMDEKGLQALANSQGEGLMYGPMLQQLRPGFTQQEAAAAATLRGGGVPIGVGEANAASRGEPTNWKNDPRVKLAELELDVAERKFKIATDGQLVGSKSDHPLYAEMEAKRDAYLNLVRELATSSGGAPAAAAKSPETLIVKGKPATLQELNVSDQEIEAMWFDALDVWASRNGGQEPEQAIQGGKFTAQQVEADLRKIHDDLIEKRRTSRNPR
jgi:hypothetical protein